MITDAKSLADACEAAEPGDIAARLSEGQREGLTGAFPSFGATGERQSVAFSTGSANSLVGLGLAECLPGDFWPTLTPLGLAVRDHLLRDQHHV